MVIRCRSCNCELQSTDNKMHYCKCDNHTCISGTTITAEDLSKVVVVEGLTKFKKSSILSSDDMKFQEQRRQRKVRKLQFEER
jgi:hypothetical protein